MAARVGGGARQRELVIRKGTSNTSEKPPGEEIFDIVTLNNLEVSGFAELFVLSTRIINLENLLHLVLKQNSLTLLPPEIGSLKVLKCLDVSSNALESIPAELYGIESLQTLVLNDNKLRLGSFPDFPSKEFFAHLQCVNIASNQLEELPGFLYHCSQLAELMASGNQLQKVLPGVGTMGQMRCLDLSKNSISELPRELSNCSKIRTLLLTDNPIADRRLLKLINQHGATKPRTVLDYVLSHGTVTAQPAQAAAQQLPEAKGKKKKKKGKISATTTAVGETPGDVVNKEHSDDDDDDEGVIFAARYCVVVTKPSGAVEVHATQVARAVRPYLVCCVVKNVDLASPGNFKKFINIQTKLHDGLCRKRKLCTVATHDLSRVRLPLIYTAAAAESIRLVPLGCSKPVSVKEFVSLLETNKPASTRGGAKSRAVEKPPNQMAASLSKYLELVTVSDNFPYLVDAADRVISLPPLTNSESSKITPDTSDILVEVTSSRSLQSCKTALDSLVLEMLHAGTCCAATVDRPAGQEIVLEQCRVLDDAGDLLVAYPARPDLAYNDDDIEVKRI